MAATLGDSIATEPSSPTAQTPQRLASVLVGALVGSWREPSSDPHALRKFRSASFAGRTFYITSRRLGRRSATRRDGRHRALEFDSTPDERHDVARADFT